MRDTRTAVPDLDESVVGSILRWWAMCSDDDESRQPKLLDFAGPVGPLRDEAQLLNGPNMVGQVRIWASKLAARFGSFCDCLNENGWG